VVHHSAAAAGSRPTRGKGGGLRLARPACEIRVGRVVREAEGSALPAECFGEAEPLRHRRLLALKGVLAEAVKAFYDVLDPLHARRHHAQRARAVAHPALPSAAAPREAPCLTGLDSWTRRVAPFPYDGPEELRASIGAALQARRRPEMALSIVDAGLVSAVT
jgi:hypothetical protein